MGRVKKTSGGRLIVAAARNQELGHCSRNAKRASERSDTQSVWLPHNPTFGVHVRIIKLQGLFSKPGDDPASVG
jgi:hypothetical protein